MSHGPFQKKYLVSSVGIESLGEQYKRTLAENSRLMHAARLAGEQHVLLTSDLPFGHQSSARQGLGSRAASRHQTYASDELNACRAAADDDEEDDLAQGSPGHLLEDAYKKEHPKRPPCQTTVTKATPAPKGKSPIAVPLPDDDWKQNKN